MTSLDRMLCFTVVVIEVIICVGQIIWIDLHVEINKVKTLQLLILTTITYFNSTITNLVQPILCAGIFMHNPT